MKRLLLFLLVIGSWRAPAAEWMKLPAYERAVLPNGATLLLMEKHDAPLINLSLALRSGSTEDPAGREGTAELVTQLLRKGAGDRSAAQLSEEIDGIGATLNAAASLEATRLELDFLAKDLKSALSIFFDLALEPRFPEEEVEKLVKQSVDEIKAAKDEPLQVLGSYYKQFLFGRHPYGRPVTGDEQSLGEITRDAVVRFHREHYVSSNMVLVAVGDFTTANLRKLLSERLGKLPPKGVVARAIARPAPATGSRLLLVDKPDSTQTFFALGNTGIAMDDPDRLAIMVANTLFGGRFTSRLNTALRIDSGFSYGARSAFTPLRAPGEFVVVSYTRNEETQQALETTLRVLQKFTKDGITQIELDSARAYLKGQFGPALETPAQLGAQLALFEIYGLNPQVEVDQYAARLDALTLDQVRAAIQRAFPTDNLTGAVIGKASDIKSVLKKFTRKIEATSITAPGFGPNK